MGTIRPLLLTRHISETELNKNKFVLIIMIDLSLAFDTINTDNILTKKLKSYGANDKATDLFRSFFTQKNIIQNGKMLNLTLLTFITTAWSKGLRLDHLCIIFTHQI